MKGDKKRNILLAVISVIVVAALLAVFIWYRSDSAKTRAELESKAAQIAQADQESSADDASEEETEEEAVVYTQISCRGDAYLSYGAEGSTYAELLAVLLEEAGYDVEVEDNTLDMAGSLSQLYYAGIDTSIIEDYMAAHEAAALASSITATDTEIATRATYLYTEEDLERSDEDYLPVISIGYRGGWYNDLDELIEQQTLILETYSQQSDFIIIGINGSSSVSDDEYDAAMQEAWGDNYLSLNDIAAENYTTDSSVRDEIAEAVFEKLVEMGYIQK